MAKPGNGWSSVEKREQDGLLKVRYDTPHGPLFETSKFTVDRTWRVIEFPAKRAEDLPALGGTHGETGEIVVAGGIHPGQLRRFAPDQRAAGLTAALGDPGDDVAPRLHVQDAGRVVIQEKQGFRTLNHQVVHAHGHQIDADGAMVSAGDGDLELGAHAVGGGHQDGIGISRGAQVEQGAKTAEAGGHARTVRGFRQGFDRVDKSRAGVDIDAGLFVTETAYLFLPPRDVLNWRG